MPIVPTARLAKIEFYEAHLPVWQANADSIGLTLAQVTALQGLTTAARAAATAQKAAQDAAKAATANFYNAVYEMQIAGADAIRAIKNLAETSQDPNVYVLAAIPAPLPPSPTPPPGTPESLRVELLQTGALKLTFKCENPEGTQGTVYEVRRRIGLSGAFEYIGATGVKSFTDETLPSGSPAITYQITAIRSTATGNPAQFTINFGVTGDGARVATVSASGNGNGSTLAADQALVNAIVNSKGYTNGSRTGART